MQNPEVNDVVTYLVHNLAQEAVDDCPEQQQRTRRRHVKKLQADGCKGVHALNITEFRFRNKKGEQQLGKL